MALSKAATPPGTTEAVGVAILHGPRPSDSNSFTEFESINHRWPDLRNGMELLERAQEVFVVKKNVNIKFYDLNGSRNADWLE